MPKRKSKGAKKGASNDNGNSSQNPVSSQPQNLSVPESSESVTSTPVSTPTASGAQDSAPQSEMEQHIKQRKEQDELDRGEAAFKAKAMDESSAAGPSGNTEQEEAGGDGSEASFDSPNSDLWRSQWGLGGRRASADSNLASPEESQSVEESQNDHPFTDETPSYVFKSVKPIPRSKRGLFVDPVPEPLSDEESTEGVQIYDPETNGAADGSFVRPRTPPEERFAAIVAKQKANAKARKEAAEREVVKIEGADDKSVVAKNVKKFFEEQRESDGVENELAKLKSENAALVAKNKKLEAMLEQVGLEGDNDKTQSDGPKRQIQRRPTGANTKSTRHGRPSENAVSLAILRIEEGLKHMRASRASKGIVQGDLQTARIAMAEAYTMSKDLEDAQLRGRSLFWIAIVEFYDGNPLAARKAIEKAESYSEWEIPEDEKRWLDKWLDVTMEDTRPSQNSLEYKDVLGAKVPSMTEITASHKTQDGDWEKVAGRGSRVDSIAAKKAENKRSKWDALAYYI